MPVSTNTKNVIEEMRRNGVAADVLASLERELDSKESAEKGFSNGILAQASFSTYQSNRDKEVRELKENLTKLQSLQGAATNLTGDLQQAAIEQVAALEKIFIDQGYDIEEVRAETAKLVSDPNSVKALVEKKDEVITGKEKEMVNSPDNKNYVDNKTLTNVLTASMSNLAAGGINMSVQIARAMHEANKLGIDLTDDKLNGFSDAIIKGLEANKQPNQVMDEYFGFSAVRTTKAEEVRKAELETARQEGAREALKTAGVTIRKSPLNSNRQTNSILDRKRIEVKREEPKEVKIEDLPKNEKGDPEYFRLRNFDINTRRSRHTENATNRWEEVKEEYDDDGMYIGNRTAANA
jgi:ribosomal protein L16/L10AE